MTLSPNAQEFIPIAYSIPSVQTFVLDPSTGTTSPVIISHIPFSYTSSPYYAPNQFMIPNQIFYQYPSNLPAPVQTTQSLSVPHEPYIADQKMYQKVFNNINRIKQTIECHYNIQNQPDCLTPKNSMVFGKSGGKISHTNQNIKQAVGFKLNDGDFPQLGLSGNTEKNINPECSPLRASSDEKSNDSTPKSNIHSLNTEFANMVTALQLGPDMNCKKDHRSRNHACYSQLVVPQFINPLDSTCCVKRGKEHEKPRKKKSTLKKIILREREEKKKQQEQNIESLDDDSSDTANLNHLFNADNDELNENQVDDQIELISPISQNSPSSYNPSPCGSLNFNTEHCLSLDKLEERAKQKIHSRKFREYCHQIINKDIDETCTLLLQEIVRFQDRLYQKNPIKAKLKRRYVMGIREVTKHLKLFRIKCVILAPNCEKIESKGGLDDAINLIIRTSMEQNIPFLFALGRKGLGKAVNKLVPVSVVGIFDYGGAEHYFEKLVGLANNAKMTYQHMVEEFEREECENLITNQSNIVNAINENLEPLPTNTGPLVTSQIFSKIPSHMAHSRTPSNGSNISIEPFYHMNYHHSHSRSASGTFNYGHTTLVSGHSRSASGGGIGAGGINFDVLMNSKSWTHSRTPSNCSNISYISRLSEPISELDNNFVLNSTQAAVNFYNEQVKQEMKDLNESSDQDVNVEVAESLANIHLGCINESDAGNDAESENVSKP